MTLPQAVFTIVEAVWVRVCHYDQTAMNSSILKIDFFWKIINLYLFDRWINQEKNKKIIKKK